MRPQSGNFDYLMFRYICFIWNSAKIGLSEFWILCMSTSAFQPLITTPQLGQLLLTARKRRKLTQTAVAQRLGLSQNRILHLEQHSGNKRQATTQLVCGNRTGAAARRTNRRRAEQLR